MISKQNYTNENFPVEIDLAQQIYNLVYNAIYKHPAIIQSGLYEVHSFYNLKEDKTTPKIFGTLFSGEEYAEVLFSEIQGKEKGKLEIKLFGENSERLLKIRFELKNKIETKLDEIKKNA